MGQTRHGVVKEPARHIQAAGTLPQPAKSEAETVSGSNTWVYHITHFDNLGSILVQQGLDCTSRLQARSAGYRNIARQDIQESRATWEVPLPPGGVLHDYVPFYFAPRSPMLYSIHTGYVPTYKGGQSDVIYLVCDAQYLATAKVPFVFTDGHASSPLSDYFNDLDDLSAVDWAIMKEQYWRNTLEDGDRKRRRMAEFLVHAKVPLNLVSAIGVIDKEMQGKVTALLKPYRFEINVGVVRSWYY